ncbi:hypothetical protein CFE70_010546 [Pyrenophora teres f. teres 0-1]|uniref:Uncharacterized protein n=1 Tax=Pyrenophora teres f. teres (strain 0-1) TaxID=861557 RepID=E3RWD7_PYRTT|nr:hypothetical protein PTT_13581 [Pyrenophora teres f. teres 0-1]KAE8859321.1 hypothetical protein PTNB29_06552 [Pyrenophora teres f. teres]
MSTHQRQHPVSRKAFLVGDNTVRTEMQPATAGLGSADEASSRSASPISHSTRGFCKTCDNIIGDFYNSWYRITGSYYVPALLGSYSVLLKSAGKLKAASKGTDLEGCTIQPLVCPHPTCNDVPLGFTVITAPAGKNNFRGRDFFKLSRIELRCARAGTDQYIVVKPREGAAPPDLLATEDTPSPSSSISTPKASSTTAMEVDSRPSSFSHVGYPHGLRGQAHNHHRPQPAMHQIDVSRHLVTASPMPMHSPIPSPVQSIIQKTASNPVSPPTSARDSSTEDRMPNQESSRESATNAAGGGQQAPPSGALQVQSLRKTSHTNGHTYPRSPHEIGIEAIERLQTQISQNSGALSAHTRDIRRGEEFTQQLEATLRQEFQTQLFRQNADIQRLEESQQRLHHDVQGMRHTMEAVRHELQAMRVDKQSRAGAVLDRSFRGQEGAVELMAKQIAELSHKTSDIDHLKVHIEIMKGKIHRLEQAAAHAASRSPLQPYHALKAPVSQPLQPPHIAAPPHRAPPAAPPNEKTLQPTPEVQHRRPSFPVPSSVPATASIAATVPAPTPTTSWEVVNNAGTKRSYQSGVESPREATINIPSSPKRQKLDSTTTQAPTPTVQPQTSAPEPSLASQTQQSIYAPYATQDAPSDQSWQPESQRMIEHRPRGRGRGGGIGGRGGRVRRSMPGHLHDTIEWEKDDWHGDSHVSPDSFYDSVSRGERGGIARRGSGGGGARGGYAGSERANSLGLQGVSTGMHFGFGSSQDSLYGSGKKTRTKPVRNADGVLIRKDGRPDMRSQSSAANLRKVHQRKEGDASHSPTAFTSVNGQSVISINIPDSPSPSGYPADPTASDKHNAIMGKMFPAGLDASRKQHDYSRQAFEDDDQTIHVRRESHGVTTRSAHLRIKSEQVESPSEQDADMSGTEEQGEIEHDQSPERRSSQCGGVELAEDGPDDDSAEQLQAEAEEERDESHTGAISQTVAETQVPDSSDPATTTAGAGEEPTPIEVFD